MRKCLSGSTIREVAGEFNLHWTTVHKIVQRHRRKARQGQTLAKLA
ncbi:hypothetical protein IT408_02100 [Candidatus Uhrbacteria bacterium]|nr:hypothetical protein [Candidatus Uhrbacteria bacterium]